MLDEQSLKEFTAETHYSLFDFDVPASIMINWKSQLPAKVVAVSVGCGSPPNEPEELSKLVERELDYIGMDYDESRIFHGDTSIYSSRARYPLAAKFVLRDLTNELPPEEQNIADILVFNHPDVLGTEDAAYDYSGAPAQKWIKIVNNGLMALKKSGIVCVATLQKREHALMRSYLNLAKVQILYEYAFPKAKIAENYGVLIGQK